MLKLLLDDGLGVPGVRYLGAAFQSFAGLVDPLHSPFLASQRHFPEAWEPGLDKSLVLSRKKKEPSWFCRLFFLTFSVFSFLYIFFSHIINKTIFSLFYTKIQYPNILKQKYNWKSYLKKYSRKLLKEPKIFNFRLIRIKENICTNKMVIFSSGPQSMYDISMFGWFKKDQRIKQVRLRRNFSGCVLVASTKDLDFTTKDVQPNFKIYALNYK